MLFHSIDFAVFIVLVFFLHWYLVKRSAKLQNLLILVASYVFYGWWDWRFLGLILISTIVDYTVANKLMRTNRSRERKTLIWVSILVNIGILAYFKYANFFIESFVETFRFFGFDVGHPSLQVILPVGISFYTFQTLSYTIDVYKGKMHATKDFIAFAAFVSFFPQLVAGPIERAVNLLPQFEQTRTFDYSAAIDGCRQILWGFFKKMVIADNAAKLVDEAFICADCSGSTYALGLFLFAFQIYCDFSGYSDIAIGLARLFGIRLMQNFAFPYFSRDIAEFWRRWHISLSTWFRDYVYIPLGGSRGSNWMKIRNTFIVFAVSGLWHGANWTFVVWGIINAIYFIPLLILNRHRRYKDFTLRKRAKDGSINITGVIITFSLTCLAWTFFRAESMPHAFGYIKNLCSNRIFEPPDFSHIKALFITIGAIILLLIIEWKSRFHRHGLERFAINWPAPLRHLLYYSLVIAIIWFAGDQQEFIYFQF